jgi:hypothetical protein
VRSKAEIDAERKLAADYRLHQAQAVLDIVHTRHPGQRFRSDWFAVVGNFNSLNVEPPAQLVAAVGLEDVVSRLPVEQRWTEYHAGGGSIGQLDYLFVSPALAAATAGHQPYIERRGIGMRETSTVDGKPLPKRVKLETADDQPPTGSIDFRFDRFPGVGPKAKASDHCPVFLDLP